MGDLAISRLGWPGDSIKDELSGFFSLALLLWARPTEGARFSVFVEKRVLAGTGSCKLPVFFDEDFDGNPCKPDGEQRNSQENNFPFHAAKLGGSERFSGR